jgi:hypothetical protein
MISQLWSPSHWDRWTIHPRGTSHLSHIEYNASVGALCCYKVSLINGAQHFVQVIRGKTKRPRKSWAKAERAPRWGSEAEIAPRVIVDEKYYRNLEDTLSHYIFQYG